MGMTIYLLLISYEGFLIRNIQVIQVTFLFSSDWHLSVLIKVSIVAIKKRKKKHYLYKRVLNIPSNVCFKIIRVQS